MKNDPRKKAIRTEYKMDKAAAKSSKRAEMAAVKGKIPNTFEAKERMFEKGLDKSPIMKRVARRNEKTERVIVGTRSTPISGVGAKSGAKQPAKASASGKSGVAKSAVAPIRKAAMTNESRSNPEKRAQGPLPSRSIPGRRGVSDAEMKAKIEAAKNETEGVWRPTKK
jgi:hypothetical protein